MISKSAALLAARRLALIAAVLSASLAGCTVTEPDYRGKACSGSCPTGFRCSSAGTCIGQDEPDPEAGKDAGGTPDAATVTPDGGGLPDAADLTYPVTGTASLLGVQIAGVEITVDGQTAKTNASGVFTVAGVHAGTFPMALKSGPFEESVPAMVVRADGAGLLKAADLVPLDIELSRAHRVVSDALVGGSATDRTELVSPDQKLVAFRTEVSTTKRTGTLQIASIGGGAPVSISPNVLDGGAVFTANSARILFFRKDGTATNLCSASAGGGAVTVIGAGVPEVLPRISADGSSVLFFTSYDPPTGLGALAVAGVLSGKPTPLGTGVKASSTGWTFPLDGTLPYFVSNYSSTTGSGQLYYLTAGASAPTKIADFVEPNFLLGGSTSTFGLMFFANYDSRSDTGNLHVAPLDSAAATPVGTIVVRKSLAFASDGTAVYVSLTTATALTGTLNYLEPGGSAQTGGSGVPPESLSFSQDRKTLYYLKDYVAPSGTLRAVIFGGGSPQLRTLASLVELDGFKVSPLNTGVLVVHTTDGNTHAGKLQTIDGTGASTDIAANISVHGLGYASDGVRVFFFSRFDDNIKAGELETVPSAVSGVPDLLGSLVQSDYQISQAGTEVAFLSDVNGTTRTGKLKVARLAAAPTPPVLTELASDVAEFQLLRGGNQVVFTSAPAAALFKLSVVKASPGALPVSLATNAASFELTDDQQRAIILLGGSKELVATSLSDGSTVGLTKGVISYSFSPDRKGMLILGDAPTGSTDLSLSVFDLGSGVVNLALRGVGRAFFANDTTVVAVKKNAVAPYEFQNGLYLAPVR